MNKNLSGRVAAAALAAGSVIFAAGCSGSGESPEEPPAKNSLLTSLSEICEGIFDSKTVAEVEKSIQVTDVYQGEIDKAEFSSAKVGGKLGREMDAGGLGTPVCFFDDKLGGKKQLEITFGWGFDAFPSDKDRDGSSTTYRIGAEGRPATTTMLVNCQRPDLVEQGEEMHPVEATLDDRMGLSTQARITLLHASAQKVLSAMKCQNEIDFPDPASIKPVA
ncbi:hypothetical protein ACFVWX_21085 [Streptomyces sp. NPDC058220]|uniref:hypothetical protein n=1 Tax=Streptomyces sp. NPDC058220 TaxID=3346387 RepID=UPI0036E0CDBD